MLLYVTNKTLYLGSMKNPKNSVGNSSGLMRKCRQERQFTKEETQANLRDSVCSVPDHNNKVNISVKQAKWNYLVSQCI